MSSTNLTRAEAQQRTALLTIHSYDIGLTLCDAQGQPFESTFESTTVVEFTVTPGQGESAFFDLRCTATPTVELVRIDSSEDADGTAQSSAGHPTATVALTGEGTYDATQGILLQHLTVGTYQLTVTATCDLSTTGEGLHRFVDPEDQRIYLYTQCETADAKRIFACCDQPDLKAVFDITVTAPAHWEVASCAPVETTATDATVTTTRFATTPPLPTYLFALIAGDYSAVSDTYTGTCGDQEITIPLRWLCRASLAEYLDADRLFSETEQGFDFYHAHFGLAYPFGKYDQIMVPEFNAGAMENPGAVTYRDEYVFRSRPTAYRLELRNDTILHEMAHMWFGDIVTMAWWDDLWLNESFATFAAALAQVEATEYRDAWITFAMTMKLWAYREDQRDTTHPVYADASDVNTADQNFDGITYAKGASLLKQLVAYVGVENFLAGVREHLAAHAFGNATFDDLLGALTRASGRDLSGWADMYLNTTGVTTLTPQATVTDGTYDEVAIVQSPAAPGAGEFRDHEVRVGVYDLVDGAMTRITQVGATVSGERTIIEELASTPAGAFIIANDDDLAYTLIGFDLAARDAAASHAHLIADPMARCLIVTALYEQTRTARFPAPRMLDILCRVLPVETTFSVVDVLLTNAITVATQFIPAEQQGEACATLTATLIGVLEAEETPADLRLPVAQAVAKLPADSSSTPLLRAILTAADEASVSGLTVDSELRWRAAAALAMAGLLSAEEVAELAARDTSSQGALWLLTVQAAAPDLETKQEFLTALLDTRYTRHELTAVAQHLVPPNQRDLADAVGVWFLDHVTEIWATHSATTAMHINRFFFPRWRISEDTVARVDALLEQDLDPALARSLRDGRTDIALALAAQRAS